MSAAALPARRAGRRWRQSSCSRRARPISCARTRSAFMSTPSTGAANSTRRHCRRSSSRRRARARSRRARPASLVGPRQPAAGVAARSGSWRRRTCEPSFTRRCTMIRTWILTSSLAALAPSALAQPPGGIAAANKAALREPAAAAFVNAVQVYPFADGVLYRLYTAPERISDIALQPGETLISVAAGDTVRWTVGDTTSGSGEGTAHPYSGQAVQRRSGDQPCHHHRPARLSDPARQPRERGDERDQLDLSAGRNAGAGARARRRRGSGTGLGRRGGRPVELSLPDIGGHARPGDRSGPSTTAARPGSSFRRRSRSARRRRCSSLAIRARPSSSITGCRAAIMSSTGCLAPPSFGSARRSRRSSGSRGLALPQLSRGRANDRSR